MVMFLLFFMFFVMALVLAIVLHNNPLLFNNRYAWGRRGVVPTCTLTLDGDAYPYPTWAMAELLI